VEPRIDYARRFPDLRDAMWALEHYVHQSGLDPKLLELVKPTRIAYQRVCVLR